MCTIAKGTEMARKSNKNYTLRSGKRSIDRYMWRGGGRERERETDRKRERERENP